MDKEVIFDICNNIETTYNENITLTEDNYFSAENNKKYMSVSRFKRYYMNCEFMAKAQDDGLYVPNKSESLIQGSYIDAWNNGEKALAKFIEQNNKILISSRGETKGQLKAAYKTVGDCIETLKNDPLCLEYLSGQKQQIFTAKLFDVDWKVCLDNYKPEANRFTDLKCMENFEWMWDAKERKKVTFVQSYGYDIQMAIYRKVVGLATGVYLDPFIIAVSKQKIPDKAILSFELAELNARLDDVENYIERIIMISEGELEPKRCEKCEYCRMTKMLTEKDIRHHAMV